MKVTAMAFPKNYYQQPEEIHHDVVEVTLCREGSGTIVVEGKAYPVHAGDILFIPPGLRHADNCNEPRRNGHLRFDAVSALPKEFRIIQDPSHRLETLFDLAADALLLPSPEQRAFAYALGDAMLLLLLEWFAKPQVETNAAVEAIDQIIRQRFQDVSLDLTEEIRRSGYSVSYFRQIFHQQIGRPPQAQLNYVRIEYAKSQMQIYGETLPIKVISLNSGFQDPYYFSRVFKQYVGKAPSEYLAGLSA